MIIVFVIGDIQSVCYKQFVSIFIIQPHSKFHIVAKMFCYLLLVKLISIFFNENYVLFSYK